MSEQELELHPHPEKVGRVPLAWDAKVEKKIPAGTPSHGLTSRGKSNAHGRDYDAHKNTGIALVGDEHD